LKDPFKSFRIFAGASWAYLQSDSNVSLIEQQESIMNRISKILIAAAIVASTAGAANAQAFTSGWGTGNVQPTHYDAAGKLVLDNAQQNSVVRTDRSNDGLSAFALAPEGKKRVR
jgi:hypothetical protein